VAGGWTWAVNNKYVNKYINVISVHPYRHVVMAVAAQEAGHIEINKNIMK
jgi:hypothetical protein